MHPVRQHGRTEPRILYWYRTPPYIRVGRAPFDDEAKRLLEERHPDVSFDWGKILREPPQPLPEREAVRRRDQRESRDARRRKKRRPEMQTETAAGAAAEETGEATLAEFEPEPREPGEPGEPMEPGEPFEPVEPEEPAVSSVLGVESAARLRNRYVVLKQRIERCPDEAKRAELRAELETLNPDAWETVEAVRRELDTYEGRYEALRAKVGPRTRRRRRGRRTPRARKGPESGL